MDRHLHIITHEVPWPADYGGLYDLFYKIKYLHQAGIKIHLHCFSKQKNNQPILNRYCESVQYYSRKKCYSVFQIGIPYIVQSRRSRILLDNLNKDDYPILMEGIHCTFYHHLLAQKRKIFIRLHNSECNYYKHLADYEYNFFRKMYFKIESLMLHRYEKKLAKNANYWCVSKLDIDFYKSNFQAENMLFLPVFTPWTNIKSLPGVGNYCLYHGNLSVNENEKAAIWLLEEVFSKINIPFVIAGKNPSHKLKKLAHSFSHTCIVENLSEHEMDDLIKKAQINILPSFNKTGVKLKILHALTNGRHCLVNNNAVKGTGLSQYCHIANDSTQFKDLILQLFQKSFNDEEVYKRNEIVEVLYNNTVNAELINTWIH